MFRKRSSPEERPAKTSCTPERRGTREPLEGLFRLFVALSLAGCSLVMRASDTTPYRSGPPTVIHGGWNDVVALGASTPLTQAPDLTGSSAQVTFSWNDFTLSHGTIESWNVYRSTSSGGQGFSVAAHASGIGAGVRSFTDTAVVAGQTYYYVVRPVFRGGTALATSESFSELKVVIPPPNMALVHRWIANLEMCGLMGRTPDPENDYRCAYIGPGNVSGYFDIGKSILVDRYETGCGYTPAPSCGANGCIGNAVPSDAVGSDGEVFYSRLNDTCYFKKAGTWVQATDATLLASERAAMATNRPGAPPLVKIDQIQGWGVCAEKTETGFTGTKRLLSHRERVVAGAWDPALTDAGIGTVENGLNLPGTGHCNTNSGAGLSYENSVIPADLDTIAACQFGDCAAGFGNRRMVRTGSVATRNCQSRYGIRDLAGNIWEWTSDQLASCSSVTHTCSGGASALDPGNTDWLGFEFDGVIGPGGGGSNVNSWRFHVMSYSATRIQLPLGLPMVGAAPASFDSLAIGTGAGEFDPAKFHDDNFWLNTVNPTGVIAARGTIAGGNWAQNSAAGRFTVGLNYMPEATFNSVGVRCALDAE